MPHNIDNPDKWPEYELHNARVYLSEDSTTMTSLLQASEHHPLPVFGDVQLHSIPKSRYNDVVRLKDHRRSASIAVDSVSLFAYGQYDDGTVAIWAAGKAGWYTLKPSRAYRATYQEMVGAINMLYFVADAYREERFSGKGKSAKPLEPYSVTELFEKYAKEVLNNDDALEDAEEQVYLHKEFLISCMLMGKEGMDWMENPLHLHFKKIFPDEYEAVVRRTLGPSTKRARLSHQRTREQSIDSASTTSNLKRSRKREKTFPHQSRLDRGSDHGGVSVDSDSAGFRTGKVMPSTHNNPKSPDLSRSKSGARRGVPKFLSGEAREIPATSKFDAAVTPASQISDGKSEPRRAGKSKSSLRPKSSHASKGGKGKAPIHAEDEDDEHDEEDDDTFLFVYPAFQPAGKRKSVAELDGSSARQWKRRNSRQDVDEGIDMPESPSNGSNSPEADAGAANETTPDLAVRLKHKSDPVQEDTWVCALDGCSHKVYLASHSDSQHLIKEHYALHAYDDDQRVQLVKKLQHPSLPVSHLMEKVKMQAKLEGFPGSRVAGSRYPNLQPIAQKY